MDSRIAAYNSLDFDASMEVSEHVNVHLGTINLTDKQPPVIGLIASRRLINGNMGGGHVRFAGEIPVRGSGTKV